MVLIDAHVHIYDCFDLAKFFDSAYANFKSAAERLGCGSDFIGILLFAETSKDNWFNHLRDYAGGKALPESKKTGGWKFRYTDEKHSLIAESEGAKNILLVAGRQVVTAEGLEVLACATTEQFSDDTPIEKLIKEIRKKDGLPIIPWGVGKWLGTKGKIIKEVVDKYRDNTLIYLGDNGNRPAFWPQPNLFEQARQKGIQVLPGSDPLPFASESGRAGSYGFVLPNQIDSKNSATLIKQKLMYEVNYTVRVFGRLEKIHRFLQNQIRAQFRKRFAGINLN